MTDVIAGLLLGAAYVAAPGPIGIETLRQGMKGGLAASLAVQAGSSIGLAGYALAALWGAGLLLQGAWWQLAAAVGGMALLLYLGLSTIRDGRCWFLQARRPASEHSIRRAFGRGALLSLVNPLEILFWLSLANRVMSEPGLDGPAFLSSFFAGCIASALALVCFAAFWHARLTARAALLFSWISGLAFITFGLRLGLSAGQQLAGLAGALPG